MFPLLFPRPLPRIPGRTQRGKLRALLRYIQANGEVGPLTLLVGHLAQMLVLAIEMGRLLCATWSSLRGWAT
jgi:hypothetical protein